MSLKLECVFKHNMPSRELTVDSNNYSDGSDY